MKIDLRAALLEANMRQYAAVMEQASEPTFSPKYKKNCMQMLSNPNAWAKRFGRPLWKKTLQAAACILLAFTLTLGALMSVSPTVRAAVMNWFREIREGMVSYMSTEMSEQLASPTWRPTWVPENFALQDIWTSDNQLTWDFTGKDEDDQPIGMTVMCLTPDGKISSNIGTQNVNPVFTTIHGNPAEYYTGIHGDTLIWENQEGYLFCLVTTDFSDKTLLEKIGEQMQPYSETTCSFVPMWIPEGYEKRGTDHPFAGIGKQEFLRNGDVLTFQYVTDLTCPWETDPNRIGTPVSVHGSDGLLWEATIQAGQEDTTVEIGDIVISSGTSSTMDESGVLIWTDQETNTHFQLKGILTREELLRMAESVAAVPANKHTGNS